MHYLLSFNSDIICYQHKSNSINQKIVDELLTAIYHLPFFANIFAEKKNFFD
jgi:hypothetical protein